MYQSVLIVDDDMLMLRAAKRTLRHHAKVMTASEPVEASRLALDERPDLAIVDVVLSGCSGIDLIARLKTQRPDLIVVAYTAHLTDNVAASCINARADFVEAKPRPFRDLIRLVGSLQLTLPAEIHQLEERRVREAMERFDRNVAAVARDLGIERARVYRILRRLT